jgi:outer membrane protein assembly factor BamB
MTAPRALLAAALLIALPTACSTWDPLIALGIRGQAAHKPTPLTPLKASVTTRAVWSAQVGKGGGFRFRPAVNGARIYTAAADGNVSVLDEDNGRIVTRFDTKKPLSGGVEFAEGKIYVGTLKGEVLAFDPAGKSLWTASVAGEVIAPPAVNRKIVVVRTSDGRIFGLSTEDGKRQWVFQRPSPALLLRSESGVLSAGTDIVAGYPNGKLLALDGADGTLIWEVTVMQPRGTTELERIADVAGLPVLDVGNVCAGAYQGKVACFDIRSRNMLWSRDISSARNLARDARNIYVVDDNGAVHGLDKTSGAVAWKQDKLLHRRLTSPVVIEGLVVVGDGQGFLHVIAPDDGALVGRLATDGTAIETLVPVTGGVLLQTAGGTLSLVRF